MEDCAPFAFIRSQALVTPYLCSRFFIFNRPILEMYVFQVEGGLLLFQSCLHASRYGFPLAAMKMHPSFESLSINNALGLHAFFMDIHHNTSIGSILEDDSISLESKTRIHYCLGKGAWSWLVVRPFIHSLCITHFTFTSTLCSCFTTTIGGYFAI